VKFVCCNAKGGELVSNTNAYQEVPRPITPFTAHRERKMSKGVAMCPKLLHLFVVKAVPYH